MKKIEKDIQETLFKYTGINYNVEIIDKRTKNKKEAKKEI